MWPVGVKKPASDNVVNVAEFLDRYYTNYVEAEGLKSARTISGHVKALKASLGDHPVSVLEKPTEIMRFKAAFRHGHRSRPSIASSDCCGRRSTGDDSRIRPCSQPRRSIVSASASEQKTKRNGIVVSIAMRRRGFCVINSWSIRWVGNSSGLK